MGATGPRDLAGHGGDPRRSSVVLEISMRGPDWATAVAGEKKKKQRTHEELSQKSDRKK